MSMPEGALIIFDQLILGIHAHRREKRLNNRALVALKNPIGKGHCKIAHTNNNKYKNRRGREGN